jgi:outer membrane cobalamin receptor
MINRFLLILLVSLFHANSFAQLNFSGRIRNEEKNIIIGANIAEDSTGNGTVSDNNGNFNLKTTTYPASISISYVGYKTINFFITSDTAVDIFLKQDNLLFKDFVISASRFKEDLSQSLANIYKIDSKNIENTPGGDYYEGLNRLPNVDIVNNSFGLKIFNTRGFNTTSPFRITQVIDGIDNMSPGLGFGPGTLFNIPDIDIDNIEVISGPASALYGPNALQGVININSKDPFSKQGITLQLKGGSRKYAEAQFRYAQAFGKKQKVAFRVSASYFQANDWEANDPVLNNYRKIPYAPQRIGALSQSLANDTTLQLSERQKYQEFNNYTQLNPASNPGNVSFTLPGYDEKDIAKDKTFSAKVYTSLTYKITNNIHLTYAYKFNMATGIYQGNNRAFLENFRFNQHKLELKGKNFFVKSYLTHEDAGDCYDLVLTGINMGISGIPAVSKSYLNAYLDSVKILSNNYTNALTPSQITSLKSSSLTTAQNGWLVPGTDAFQNTFDKITTGTNRPIGSKYVTKSLLYHIEGQYDYKYKFLELNVGASYRRYMPKTQGLLFSDTLLANGKYAKIAYNEFGGFFQLTTRFFNDKLKLYGSLRMDKSQNYKIQFSPRVGFVYREKNHILRASFQSAFRSPTLNDQYFLLNVGSFILKGNLDGFNNAFTAASVTNYGASPTKDSTLLQTYVTDKIKPEQLKSFEVGYRMNNLKGFSLDFSMFYNRYKNFIGSANIVVPKSGIAGELSGLADIKTRNYNTYRISVNSDNFVNTLGLGINFSYSYKFISFYTNYSYNKIFDKNLNDNLIPGFNTPPHKINIGVMADKVWKGLGFGVNFHWQDKLNWQSAFATGEIKQIHTLDLEVHYEISKIMSTLKFGGSNIYNNKVKYAAGAAEIGAFVYGSWTFDMALKKEKSLINKL